MKQLLTLISLFISFSAFSQEENCPSAAKKYLDKNPDVKRSGMDAWSHYTTYGKKEGRNWPKCDESSSVEVFSDEKVNEVTVKSNSINTNGCIGRFYANVNTNAIPINLELDFRKYDSLSQSINRFYNFKKYEGTNINVNYITAQSVNYYKRKKIYCFKTGSWIKHKEKLIKLGFDEARLNDRYKWCKLYFAYDAKEGRYNELPYYELNALYIQKLGLNQYDRQYYNCSFLKKKI